jgi:hypothetical protein
MFNIVENDKLSDDDKKEIDKVFGTDDSKPITLESKYLIKIRSENEGYFKKFPLFKKLSKHTKSYFHFFLSKILRFLIVRIDQLSILKLKVSLNIWNLRKNKIGGQLYFVTLTLNRI